MVGSDSALSAPSGRASSRSGPGRCRPGPSYCGRRRDTRSSLAEPPAALSASIMARVLSTVSSRSASPTKAPDRQRLEGRGRSPSSPRPQIGTTAANRSGLRGGDRPAPAAPHREAGQDHAVAVGLVGRRARRRAPPGRPWRRRSRPPRSSRACGKTAISGIVLGVAEDRGPEADLGRGCHRRRARPSRGGTGRPGTPSCRRSRRGRRPCISARPGRS